METANFNFRTFSPDELLKMTSLRKGEQKIGEKIAHATASHSKYVLLGISEDLGPVANMGNRGCSNAFQSFLPKFLSIQSNIFLNGEDIAVLGEITMKNPVYSDFDKKPNCIDELDGFIVEILNQNLLEGQKLIVIGGGHNNAYPLIQFFAQKNKDFAVVNCDAHADMRTTDFRHSGNPFSTAFEQGKLQKYAVLGLHQSYNNAFIIEALKKNSCYYTWFDDYLKKQSNLANDFSEVLDYLAALPFGIELDMDAIAFMPSSAISPSGISVESAREYVSFFSGRKECTYLHLPEAAPVSEHEKTLVGKTLSYLVSDFLKNNRLV